MWYYFVVSETPKKPCYSSIFAILEVIWRNAKTGGMPYS